MKHNIISAMLMSVMLTACANEGSAQQIAGFEDGIASKVNINKPDGKYTASLFSMEPQVVDNPDMSGINKTAKCLGATNVADADWWGNFVQIELQSPVTISESNRYLTLMAYRSIQPKEMRIAINDYEEASQIFYGKLDEDAKWQQIEVDLYEKFAGKTLNSIWIVYSCNWSNPRSGWGEASYYIDNIKLSANPLPATVSIDPSKKYQTMEGFAASDCWMGNYVGSWDDEVRGDVARWLFSKDEDADGNALGAGLSMWRVNLGAGTAEQGTASGIDDKSRRAECYISSDGKYDWTKSAGQQYFMRKAVEYGCEHLVAFSNSAPVFMNKNGKGFADKGGACNLKSDQFDAFADYMATVASHFAGEGLNFDYISPVNEPQYDWTSGQEGCPWENSDIAKLAKALDAKITAKGVNSKILLSEAAEWTYLYKNSSGHAKNQLYALWDRASSSYIGNLTNLAPVVGGHSYWTFNTNSTLRDARSSVWDKAQQYGLGVFQTEWSLLDKEPSTETGFPASYDKATPFDIALFMAKVIHSDMVFANASSWAYWTAMDMERWGHKNRFLLVYVTPSAGVNGDVAKSGSAKASPNVWVLGNYSRFIRPGYVRIGLSGAENMNGLAGSAYISPDGHKIVAVYVNTSNSAIEANMSLVGTEAPVSVDIYLTTKDSNLKHIAHDASLSKRSFDARSVTTVVYNFTEEANGLKSPKVSQNLRLSPNVVSAGSVVSLGVAQSATSTQIVSVGGNTVANVNLVDGNSFVTPSLPAGVYIVRAGKQSGRLVVK